MRRASIYISDATERMMHIRAQEMTQNGIMGLYHRDGSVNKSALFRRLLRRTDGTPKKDERNGRTPQSGQEAQRVEKSPAPDGGARDSGVGHGAGHEEGQRSP